MARITTVAAILVLLSGCGLGTLQTARPVEKGVVELHAGTGVMANDVIKEKDGQDARWSFFEFGSRIGVTDHLDVGGKVQFFPGGVLDTRYNFLGPDNPLAISVRGGIGGAVGTTGLSLHVPVSLGISYDLALSTTNRHLMLTPYAHLGWSQFWHWGGEPDDADTVNYVEAKGHGDGLLRPTGGLRLRFNKFVQMYLEYNYWMPVVNDEGDFYKFDDTHVVLLGIGILSGDPLF